MATSLFGAVEKTLDDLNSGKIEIDEE